MRRWTSVFVAFAALAALPALCFADFAGSANLVGSLDADSYGSASISVAGNQLTVVVEVFNLDPNTSHANHIHSGVCATGGVYIGLQNVVVDGTGHGIQTSVITLTPTQLTDLALFPRFVNIHHQTTGASITCGNVVWNPTPVEPRTWGQIKTLYR